MSGIVLQALIREISNPKASKHGRLEYRLFLEVRSRAIVCGERPVPGKLMGQSFALFMPDERTVRFPATFYAQWAFSVTVLI
ncbi:MAG: hypothetical protein AB8B87_01835 [Granulosicoccus sp.]